jgi:diguanylate cyclase (GGDEF)-like protein/PAS domain S-box-containing protein
MMRRQDSLRYLAENLVLLLLYYMAGKVGLALALEHPSVSLVWPASGIALAALILLGQQSWPTIFLGAFLVNVTGSGAVATSLGIAAGNTLEAALGAYLVSKYAGGRQAFDRPGSFLRFAALAAIGSTMLSATVGMTSLALGGRAAWGSFAHLWRSWWLGDAVGDLVVVPFVVLWINAPRPEWRRREGEIALLLMSLLGVGAVVFSNTIVHLPAGSTLGYLCVIPLVWAALRFGQREVAAATLMLAGIAVWSTLHNIGPFVGKTPSESLFLLQLFLGFIVVMSLTVGAYVAQGKRIERELESARGDLEIKVRERTREISAANADLRKSEARFRDFLESAPDPLLIVDRKGRIVLVNNQAEKMFGYGRQELIGDRVDILLPERFRTGHPAARESFFLEPKARPMGEGLELLVLHKDGTEIPVEIALSPLETDKGPLVSAAIRNISRRKQSEESMARLAAVVASSEDAIVSTDADGFLTIWNAAAERVFGYPAAEALGRPSGMLSAPDHRGEMEEILERLKRREQVRHETQVMRKDGAILDVALTAFPVVDRDSRVIGFSTMFRDITAQKRSAEARQEKNLLKSQVAELSRHTHEISALSELGEVLRAAVRLSEAYPVIPRFLGDLFPTESGALYEFDEVHNLFGTVLTWGDAPPPEDAFAPHDCWGLRRSQLHEVVNSSGTMICQHLKPPILPGSLCIPLMARGKTLGLLHLRGVPERKDTTADVVVLGEYRQRLAKTVAQQISSALFDLKLQETLRDQASRDPLTGLFNRRYMEETLHRELFRADRKKTQLGFVLFDLDHFKLFNDRSGHAAGDTVLREVGTFVQRCSRAEDVLCRYGGEEFLLVLSDCSPKNAMRRAEEIRKGVKDLRLEHEQRGLGKITVSVGVALFPDHGRTLDDLFHAADGALYQAKKDGRDRVVTAENVPWVAAPGHRPEKETHH